MVVVMCKKDKCLLSVYASMIWSVSASAAVSAADGI